MTFLGALLSLGLLIVKLFDPGVHFYSYYWVYGVQAGPQRWGGFEAGLMFVRDRIATHSSIDAHEFGHTFQNCLFGPFTPLLVGIPSAIRYWYRELTPGKKHEPYDAFWAEDAATQCGEYVIEYLSR